MLKVGDTAPEIDAVTTTGERFVLSAQPGLCTVVYFYPKAFSPHCTREAKVFRDNYNELLLAGASLVGVSTDSVKTQCKFADVIKTPFPLVGDTDRSVSRGFGVLWLLLPLAKRVTFVVGRDRIVKAVFRAHFDIAMHRDGVLRFVHEYCDAARAEQRAQYRPEEPAPIAPQRAQLPA
ncbi:MAG: peroxiredoxin [Myxococcales bacterium]|nr:peroxiredoxin [Myxococcales bacterium]